VGLLGGGGVFWGGVLFFVVSPWGFFMGVGRVVVGGGVGWCGVFFGWFFVVFFVLIVGGGGCGVGLRGDWVCVGGGCWGFRLFVGDLGVGC